MAPVGEEPVLKALVFFTWCLLWRQSVDEDPPGGASGCRTCSEGSGSQPECQQLRQIPHTWLQGDHETWKPRGFGVSSLNFIHNFLITSTLKKSIILTDTQKTDRIKTRKRQFLPDKCANKVKGDKSKWPTHNFSVKLDVLCHLLSLDHEEIPRRQAFWIFKFSVQQTHADTFSCILVNSSMQSSKKIHRRSFTQI